MMMVVCKEIYLTVPAFAKHPFLQQDQALTVTTVTIVNGKKDGSAQ